MTSLTFEQVKELMVDLQQQGGKPFLAGGSVRDHLMGLEAKDFDIECYALSPDKLKNALESGAKKFNTKLNCVGESFQVYKLGSNVDISLPRRDTNMGVGHKNFLVVGDPFMSTFDACKRRDLTLNSMLWDPLTGEIIDHFDGGTHITLRLLEMVDENTFVEDSLRALRTIQFASRFGFDVGLATRETISKMDLRDLPRERIWMEFEKWLMLSPKPSVGLHLMKDLGILEKLFPELDNIWNVPQDERYHPEGSVGIHTALALDVAKANIGNLTYPEQVTVMLATLCHDLGKVETTELHEDGRITAHGHAEAGVSLARNLLDRLALHSIDGYDVRGQVLALVEQHMKPFEFHRNPPKDSAFRRLATKVDLNLLHKVCHSDAFSRNQNSLGVVFGTEGQDWFLEKITNLAIPPTGPEKVLLGRHLIEMGMKPGKKMGEILNTVFEMQLDGKVTDLETAKQEAAFILSGGNQIDD
jgi:tRNA nucleotidyltransferase (CCA-adding enzyme)